MDIRTLKTFQYIVKYGSFARAAEELNYVQSTVTMQIQKLEKDLGVQLLERGKGTQLTEAGRMFYQQSLEITQRMEQLQVNIADLQTGDAGVVRIGATDPTASYRLPNIIKQFVTQYPRIRISVDVSSTPILTEKLLSGDLDFAICSTPDMGTHLYFQPLLQEKFVVLLPEGHPLTKQDKIDAADFHSYCLLITSSTCPYRKKLERVLQESGGTTVNTMEISSMMALKNYVKSGLGIALVPESVLDPLPEGTTMRVLSGEAIDMLTGMLSRNQEGMLNAAASKLYKFVEKELRDI